MEQEAKARTLRQTALVKQNAAAVAAAQTAYDASATAVKGKFDSALDIPSVPGKSSAEVSTAVKQFESLAKAGLAAHKPVEQLGADLQGLAKSLAGNNGKQLEAFGSLGVKALQKVQAEAKKSDTAFSALAKRGVTDAGRAARQLTAEFDQFGRSVDDVLGIDRLPKLTKEIAEAFKAGDRDQISAALDRIGQAALKAAVPMAELNKRVNEQAKAFKEQQQAALNADVATGNLAGLEAGKDEPVKSDAGKVFGIDFGSLNEQTAQAIEGGLQLGFSTLGQAATTGIHKSDLPGIGQQVGSLIGAGLAAYFSGGNAAATAGGASLGGFIGGVTATLFGHETAQTTARKQADRYFADIFDADRLSVVVNGQIKRIRDLVFDANANKGANQLLGAAGAVVGGVGGFFVGGPAGAVEGAGEGYAVGANQNRPNKAPGFNSPEFAAGLDALPATAQNAFKAVGTAFEQFLGVSDELSGKIAQVLVNNIGGSLENLQVLVQATGKTFEQLGDAVLQSFLNGNLSIQQAQAALEGLNAVFTAGLPGVGQVQQAFENFQTALKDGKGSRYLLDSIRDIGAEAQDLGVTDFPTLAQRMVSVFGLSADQVRVFFEAAKASGLASIADLINASNAQLVAFAANVQRLTQGKPADAKPVTDPTAGVTPPGNFTPGAAATPTAPRSSGVSSAQSAASKAADDAKQKQEQLRAEVFKTLEASKQYAAVQDQVAAGTLKAADAGQAIKKLYAEIEAATKRNTKAQQDYQDALERGVGGKKLGELAAMADAAQKALDRFNKAAAGTNTVLDLSKVAPFIKDLNTLGEVSTEVGISLDKTVSILVEGFRRGKLSVREVSDQIRQATDLLGGGIPGAVGAVDVAFKNLIRGGQTGGAFSIDAFKDVFVEAEEKFKAFASTVNREKLTGLTKSLADAQAALQQGLAGGVSGDPLKALQDGVTRAKKELDDLTSTTPKAGFEDLRSYLQDTFSPDQVDKFFGALRESGINSFDAFSKASDKDIVGILGSLGKVGLLADTTADDVQGVNKALNDANVAANGGKDPLQAAVDLTQQFLTSAQGLPATFDATNAALAGLADPMTALADRLGGILTQLGELEGERNLDVVLNVRSNITDSAAQGIVATLWPNGVVTDKGSGGSPSTSTGNKKQAKQDAKDLKTLQAALKTQSASRR